MITQASEDVQDVIQNIKESSKKDALNIIAIFPVIMLLTYLFKGGYKAVILEDENSE